MDSDRVFHLHTRFQSSVKGIVFPIPTRALSSPDQRQLPKGVVVVLL